MKNFNLSLFLGCCVISIGIIISGILISNKLPDTTQIPANLSVTSSSSQSEFENFLTQDQAAAFLCINYEDIHNLIISGELDTCCTKINDLYIFSKPALLDWMNGKISDHK